MPELDLSALLAGMLHVVICASSRNIYDSHVLYVCVLQCVNHGGYRKMHVTRSACPHVTCGTNHSRANGRI